MNRRNFITSSLIAGGAAGGLRTAIGATGDKPALLGGTPVREKPFPKWPVFDQTEERALDQVLKSGVWNLDGKPVPEFEASYAKALGSRGVLATSSGTAALLTCLNVLGVGPGDEVIVPPYTFVATVNVVLQVHALPVFVDTDRSSLQIDATKIEAAITPRTAAIIPVHLGGNVCDVDAIMAIANRRRIPVIEDACQSHLAEWKGAKVGTFGKGGCFSFQASKNLNSGEGGAISSNDSTFLERCYAFHSNSRGRAHAGYDFSYRAKGLNLRMTGFQGAILLAQMTRLAEQMHTREQNAIYLTSMLKEIPGIAPARHYPGTTRNAYHLYMFRYDPAAFAGLPLAKFLKAMRAEHIPVSAGYSPLNKEPFLINTLQTRGYKKIYGEKELAEWTGRNQCPENDKLCQEAVWLYQANLLGPRTDMEQIAAAIRKVQKYAPELVKA
ncbi:MAG: DegT/DnrJ/EryC1/StrS family aminotransferase [Bryobacterales bacterium]|nr:DegT/DnrJ/EryC1/StrS family aminotransferase [Bryobacterales bacterium]